MSEDLPFGSRGGLAVRQPLPARRRLPVPDSAWSVRFNQPVAGKRTPTGVPPGPRPGQSSFDFDRSGNRRAGSGAGVGGLLDVRIPVRAGTRLVSASFIGRARPQRPVRRAFRRIRPVASFPVFARADQPHRVQHPGGRSVRRTDRLRTAALARAAGSAIFACAPAGPADETPCAREILSNLTRRAFRRPVTAADVDPLLASYAAGYEAGGFESGIQWGHRSAAGVAGVPLPRGAPPAGRRARDAVPARRRRPGHRACRSSSGAAFRTTKLLALAEAGRLSDSGRASSGQVRRYARRPALARAADRQLRRAVAVPAQPAHGSAQRGAVPDVRRQPPGSVPPRDGAVLRQPGARGPQRPLELLAGRLHVPQRPGSPGTTGFRACTAANYRRVRYPDERRAGTAGPRQHPDRDVAPQPHLAGRARQVAAGEPAGLASRPRRRPTSRRWWRTTRGSAPRRRSGARMEQHRSNPACAACHAKMDPLGFALENFDAVGQWRFDRRRGRRAHRRLRRAARRQAVHDAGRVPPRPAGRAVGPRSSSGRSSRSS